MTASRTVIVVEDDTNTLSGYLEFLTSAGFEAIGVADGAEALSMAVRHPPAAVITDISLPGMDGFALAEALHLHSRTREVPVIGLTAHWSPDIHARSEEVCMKAVLLKPCVPSHLVAELRRVLDRLRAAPAAANGGVDVPHPRD
jgi:DNA-binding response OmpR family regulator